jgi:hypothetical protein
MNRCFDSPGLAERASVIGSARYTQATPAKRQHLRHERQAIQFPGAIEGRQDFGGAPDFDQFAGFEIERAFESREAARCGIDAQAFM